jgi:hypothetical protein
MGLLIGTSSSFFLRRPTLRRGPFPAGNAVWRDLVPRRHARGAGMPQEEFVP